MDMADMDTQERPRSSSFRSTNSGFVHLTNWRRYSPSTSEEPSMVSTTPVSHPSPVKHRDDQELFMWKELVSSLDDHEQANICTKSIKVRCGNLREESALSGRKGMVLARAPAEDSRPILISTATSMDLLFEHFKSNNTAQMAQFLKEKACIAADGCGSHFHGLAIGRGVKRPADVIDGDSTSDVEEDLEDFLDVQTQPSVTKLLYQPAAEPMPLVTLVKATFT
ncbi:hypothetical protein BV898_02515 [Hypsibius exemplaris]|uniref:Uncharacterized protein n=1 Tax=Hypsibius exemplaris TaxID=2072580 RepID=A0A1W0X8D5_HYPEX|nr:hypothetical protein BV898_02515 [Hypsibius exemplaris]